MHFCSCLAQYRTSVSPLPPTTVTVNSYWQRSHELMTTTVETSLTEPDWIYSDQEGSWENTKRKGITVRAARPLSPQTPTLLWWILGPHICVSFGSTQAYTLWPRLASTQKDCRMLIPHLDQFWSIGLCDMTAYRIVCHHVETYISHFFLFAGRVCVVTVPALKQTDLIKRLELNQINKQNHTDQSESYTDNSNSVNYFSVLCWSLMLHAVFDKNRIKNHDFLHFLKNNLEWNNWG